jgi:hypothetical protein
MSIPHGTVTEVCYVTHDLDRAIQTWIDGVGAGPFFSMALSAEFGERQYRGAKARDSFKVAMGFSGATLIEFIQPTNDAPSVFREVLDAKGDTAMHHIMPNIRPMTAEDYDALRDRYLALGYVAAVDMVLPGLGRSIMFDARDQLGVFVELLENSPAMYVGLENMHAAHVGWDGKRPRREFSEAMPPH